MFYSLEIFEDHDSYKAALQGEPYTSSVSMTFEDEEEAFAVLRSALKAGKAITISTSSTPF